MSIGDLLFGDDSPTQQTTVSSSQLPDYVSQTSANIVNAGIGLTNQPYQPYSGPRLAGVSTTTQDAINQGIGQAGVGTDLAQQGFESITASGAPIGQGQIDQYLNPYLSSVAGNAADEMRRTSDIQQTQLDASAVQSGAFGGTRSAILEAENQRNLTRGIGDMYAQVGAQGYDTALGAAQTDRNQLMQTGLAQGQAATTVQGLGQQDVSQQIGLGSIGETEDQANLDLAYSDFLTQQQYPYEQLNFMSGLLSGTPYEMSQTTTSETTQPSSGLFQTLAGGAATGLGVAGQLGWKPFG